MPELCRCVSWLEVSSMTCRWWHTYHTAHGIIQHNTYTVLHIHSIIYYTTLHYPVQMHDIHVTQRTAQCSTIHTQYYTCTAQCSTIHIQHYICTAHWSTIHIHHNTYIAPYMHSTMQHNTYIAWQAHSIIWYNTYPASHMHRIIQHNTYTVRHTHSIIYYTPIHGTEM